MHFNQITANLTKQKCLVIFGQNLKIPTICSSLGHSAKHSSSVKKGVVTKGEDFRSLTHCLNFCLSPKLQIAKHQYIKLIETFGLRKMRVENIEIF